MTNIWQQAKIAPDHTHHLVNGVPLYKKRFCKVLKYHAPGLAPVYDQGVAYHIDEQGNTAYSSRFNRSFGFYQQRAAVDDGNGWFHILVNGKRLYDETYKWCGNFQNSYCVVCDHTGKYFHIDLNGKRIYTDKYSYVGDFRDGIAVVQNKAELYTHINERGEKIHNQYFLDLDVFHKDFARAKDSNGWFHINYNGKAVYKERYKMIEPFYNGFARVTDFYDAILIIDEAGKVIRTLKNATYGDLEDLSADIVGYWKTQAIRAAVKLQVFDHLPNTSKALATATNLELTNLLRFLRALTELELVYSQNDVWYPTSKGELLQTKHHLSLAKAALHWGNEHYLCWTNLTEALQSGEDVYCKKFGNSLFNWLDTDTSILERYQQAMHSYAYHDYKDIAGQINLSNHKIVIDAAGGQGALLHFILRHNKHLQGILLERAQVVNGLSLPPDLATRLEIKEFDLFSPWPKQGDAIFMSRVLHDWSDELSTEILRHAKDALIDGGVIYLVEMLLQQDLCNGGLLDLNMLVITGGKERTIADFNNLLKPLNLTIVDTYKLNNVANVIKIEK